MRKLTHQELISRQAAVREPRLSFTAVLNNVRSLYNVGSIFRTADGVGCEKLWLCGITGIPPSGKISKTALGAEEAVPWEYSRDVAGPVRKLREEGYHVVLLEQTVKSVPIHEFQPEGPVCLVAGNEVTGVSEELLSLSDTSVEIEMTGLKNSLNVTVAFGVAAYHIRYGLKKAAAL